MTLKPRKFSMLTLVAMLLAAAGCGNEDDPLAPEVQVLWDEITVDQTLIDVIKDCDAGSAGPGEFAYKFYVIVREDGQEKTYLSTDYTSFSANDNVSWDPSNEATFRLPRRAGASFSVRMAIRELDSVEEFSAGRFYNHNTTNSNEELWQPDNGGYSSYVKSTPRGEVVWDLDRSSACRVIMKYEVIIKPQ